MFSIFLTGMILIPIFSYIFNGFTFRDKEWEPDWDSDKYGSF